jgi:hypothetical protein
MESLWPLASKVNEGRKMDRRTWSQPASTTRLANERRNKRREEGGVKMEATWPGSFLWYREVYVTPGLLLLECT